MKNFLKFLGCIIQFLIVTILLLASFAGLYGLLHFADPVYKNNKTLLKDDAVQWAFTMTGLTFLLILGFIITIINSDQALNLIELHMEGFALTILLFLGILCIGLISGFFTLLED